jgi:hypothetical protein
VSGCAAAVIGAALLVVPGSVVGGRVKEVSTTG